jgi:hypothetical protein
VIALGAIKAVLNPLHLSLAASTPTTAFAHRIIHPQGDRSWNPRVSTARGAKALDAAAPVIKIVFTRFDIPVDALRDFQKCPLYAIARLGTGLNIANDVIQTAPFLSLLVSNLSLIGARFLSSQV